MTDFRKCIALIKYGKRAKLCKIFGIAVTALGLLAVLACFIDFVSGGADISADGVAAGFMNPCYFLFMGPYFVYQAVSSMFYTSFFGSSPLKAYAETKFMPIMQLISGSAAAALIALMGALFCISVPEAGQLTFAMLIYISVFFGAVEIFAWLFIKIPWTIILLTALAVLGNSLTRGITEAAMRFDGISAVLAGLGAALVINLFMALLCFLVNKALYRINYPKIWNNLYKYS